MDSIIIIIMFPLREFIFHVLFRYVRYNGTVFISNIVTCIVCVVAESCWKSRSFCLAFQTFSVKLNRSYFFCKVTYSLFRLLCKLIHISTPANTLIVYLSYMSNYAQGDILLCKYVCVRVCVCARVLYTHVLYMIYTYNHVRINV